MGVVQPAFAGAGEENSLHCESNFCGMKTDVYGTEKISLENLSFPLLPSLHPASPQAPLTALCTLDALALKANDSHITR